MNRSRARGFTLIEVLVTMVVIAIGLLSAAGLQAMSKKVNYDAIQRSSAATLAQAMVERLRANPGQLPAYLTTDAGSASASVDCSLSAAVCTPAQLARFDLAEWSKSLAGAEEKVSADGQYAGGLVNPTGCITAGTTAGVYLVAVAWRGITGIAAPDSSVPVDDPVRNACGQNLGRYDDAMAAGVDDRLRRIVVFSAYVSNPYAP